MNLTFKPKSPEELKGFYVAREDEQVFKYFMQFCESQESVEWDGEGLPPVGVECEWIGGGLHYGDWGLVVVRAYHGDYAWIEKLRDNSIDTVRNPAHFRPVETPAQKSARERDNAVVDMYVECGGDSSDIGHETMDTEMYLNCQSLYDAGYRKEK